MDETLFAYLDASGWIKTRSGSRRLERDSQVYDWEAGDASSSLWKWKASRSPRDAIHSFILFNLSEALALAERINAGENPESLHRI